MNSGARNNLGGQEGVTQPLLVLMKSGSRNPFSSYIQEILEVEGIFARDDIDLAVTPFPEATLSEYEVVVLANIDLPVEEQEILRRYVAAGGNLIALRPPKALADVFGLRPSAALANTRVKDRYVVLSGCHELSTDLQCRSLQFHGDMDLYIPDDADVLAYAGGDLDEPTGFAAVSTRTLGSGRTAAFAYDLARSIVRLHQGKPENASTGPNPDPDGDDRWAPNDLFIGQLDPRLKFLPQADLHQDLLVRIVNWMSASGRPAPRVWYFPDAAPCVAWFNGDSDGMVRESYDTIVSLVEEFEGRFSVYLLEDHHSLFTPEECQELKDRGHAFGQHVDLPMQVSVDDARQEVARSMSSFENAFGYRPLTNRGHCLVWPGWTEMAEILSSNGVRLDQNFIPRRFLQHGYLNGSGLPARFMREDGTLLDIFEQNTHITDDGSVEQDKFLIQTGTPEVVLQTALRMLDDCIDRFHGVFQAAFHPQLTVHRALWLLEGLLRRCQERGIPMVSGDAWVRFNEGRRAVRVGDVAFDRGAGEFHCRVSGGLAVQALTMMFPATVGDAQIASIELDRHPAEFSLKQMKGTLYALATVDVGAGEDIAVEGLYRT